MVPEEQKKGEVQGEGSSSKTSGGMQSKKKEEKTRKSSQEATHKEHHSLKARCVELEGKMSEWKERALRKQADLENLRKRNLREQEAAAKFSNQSLLTDLLEVVDNFERAIESSRESRDFESFLGGVSATERHFVNLLTGKWGLEKIPALNKPYNPQLHEALLLEESDQYSQEIVIEELQVGYTLHGRTIRPAKVKVGRPISKAVSEQIDDDPFCDLEKKLEEENLKKESRKGENTNQQETTG